MPNPLANRRQGRPAVGPPKHGNAGLPLDPGADHVHRWGPADPKSGIARCLDVFCGDSHRLLCARCLTAASTERWGLCKACAWT